MLLSPVEAPEGHWSPSGFDVIVTRHIYRCHRCLGCHHDIWYNLFHKYRSAPLQILSPTRDSTDMRKQGKTCLGLAYCISQTGKDSDR